MLPAALPAIDPDAFAAPPLLRHFELAVDGGHVLHVSEWGHPEGQPVLVLHGGPGSGGSPLLWADFDPRVWRVIAPDQRGAGRSRPRGECRHNDTADLLRDLRTLRRTLGLARWCVAGGSWGATLALAHALDEPEAVAGLLLRATFLARAEDIADFFAPPSQVEAAPVWAQLQAAAGVTHGKDVLAGLYRALHGDDPAGRERAALAWWQWEGWRSGRTDPPPAPHEPAAPPRGEALAACVDRYRVQAHYLRQGCGLGARPLLDAVAHWARVPTVLVHGRADTVCPPAGAQALHERLPGSQLDWVDGVGHDAAHPAMRQAMRRATAWLHARTWGTWETA